MYRNHQKSTTKKELREMQQIATQKKEQRTERTAILQHGNAGAEWMRREFMNTIRARQIGTACGLGMGIYAHEQAREYSDISDTLKGIY